jgi:hypothetical protein
MTTTDTPLDACPHCGDEPVAHPHDDPEWKEYRCGTVYGYYPSDLCREREARQKAEAEVKLHKGLYAAALKEWQKDAQRLSELDAEHRQWLENREKSTFQNWIDRAEKAEAEVERLRAALESL